MKAFAPLTEKTVYFQPSRATDNNLIAATFIVGVLVLIGATAPFWHIWFDQKSTQKFMGFPSIRVFLYSFGTYFAYFCFSLFVLWVKNFIDPRYKKVIRVVNVVTGVFLAISIYFLLWVFLLYGDFPKYVYTIAFAVIAVVITYAVYGLNRFVIRFVSHSRRTVKELVLFAFRVRNNHYKKVAVKSLYAETHNKAKITTHTVRENIGEFENDFYETMEKVE